MMVFPDTPPINTSTALYLIVFGEEKGNQVCKRRINCVFLAKRKETESCADVVLLGRGYRLGRVRRCGQRAEQYSPHFTRMRCTVHQAKVPHRATRVCVEAEAEAEREAEGFCTPVY